MATTTSLTSIHTKVWHGQLPLEIRLAVSESRTYHLSDPYLISLPRISYLAVLLPRLHAFFSPFFIAEPGAISPYHGHFTHDAVLLKWHLPLGLLYDIYVLSTNPPASPSTTDASPSLLPFKLTVHFSSPSATRTLIPPTPLVLHDSFINSVKEADFLRSGTAKPIMSLSAADSRDLWTSTQANDLATFSRIHNALLPPPGQFRNIPLRVYLPSPPATDSPLGDEDGEQPNARNENDALRQSPARPPQIKVLQSHIPPFISPPPSSTAAASTARRPASSSQPQPLGTALHTLVPSLFPSRRTPILARPMLHGAFVPMAAILEDLARAACYADGWLGVVVVMNS